MADGPAIHGVIPARVGIYVGIAQGKEWIPACAGMPRWQGQCCSGGLAPDVRSHRRAARGLDPRVFRRARRVESGPRIKSVGSAVGVADETLGGNAMRMGAIHGVIPARVGICVGIARGKEWIPACVGMTRWEGQCCSGGLASDVRSHRRAARGLDPRVFCRASRVESGPRIKSVGSAVGVEGETLGRKWDAVGPAIHGVIPRRRDVPRLNPAQPIGAAAGGFGGVEHAVSQGHGLTGVAAVERGAADADADLDAGGSA